jgi:acyl-CoA synthetase (AMP-forming)/AMP-acid ligase II
MTRYSGNPAATAEAFRGGWFHSQDLGCEIHDAASGARFVVITGRMKNIAKVRGESVSLDEMERLLRMVPGVIDAVCWSSPDRLWGETITAGIVFANDQQVDVMSELRRSLPANSLPARVVSIEAVPRTPTGKIVRGVLADRFAAGHEFVDHADLR